MHAAGLSAGYALQEASHGTSMHLTEVENPFSLKEGVVPLNQASFSLNRALVSLNLVPVSLNSALDSLTTTIQASY
ncbi:hypothetical protein AWM68_13710 [Fictibacillus phosphorivorans]|uniref:Uncharacterized protein n=1 Tax=Fictibacillus phosphorivorans TaxID=1221500 RepID=A0A163PUM6_9BACL|nr:hypothetical protein [Fictibacillus phosphorivorans]KZE64158.1 hypothetical protein AWM68_13710 [Fictibacillus phosphorivorans]